MKYEQCIPEDFYETKSHLWIMIDGKIRKRKNTYDKTHAEIWGGMAWSVDCCGYYSEKYGLVSCHVDVTPDIVEKLAKKFPSAMYYKG